MPLARILGIRHLSPAGACHLNDMLDAIRPTAVLVEGPADAIELVRHFSHKDIQPPIAILCYTKSRPIRSLLYPLAAYSPEWIALRWALKHKAEYQWIDLPASVFLEWHQVPRSSEEENQDEDDAEFDALDEFSDYGELDPPDESPHPAAVNETTLAYLNDPYTEIARLTGEADHETWWERHFEHTPDAASYFQQIDAFGVGLRSLQNLQPGDESLVREAYMRRCIHQVLQAGHRPEQVVVVCGAFHSSELIHELEPMSDQEWKTLPRTEVNVTLMPYSYRRLSSELGYGAGNHAPMYYQALYEEMKARDIERLSSRYASQISQAMRKNGLIRSSAEVIETVRLASSLAALQGSSVPCLRDLRDAAITCLGRGEREPIRAALKEIEIGTQVGRLPQDIGRTAIQDDFYHQIKDLHLLRYQKDELQILELDLRQNRTVKSREAAFRDLNRSTFLHRLRVLGIDFAHKQEVDQAHHTWKEIWHVQWTAECEIQLVECSLIADTIEIAAAFRLADQLATCRSIDQAAQIVEEAICCQLTDTFVNAQHHLQALAVESEDFVQLSKAITSLSHIIRYGNIRCIDTEDLKPLLSQLFLRSIFALHRACICDDTTAREQIHPAIIRIYDAVRLHADLIDTERWNAELDWIATTDSLNSYLSGLAMALRLVQTSDEVLERQLSCRLSPATPADLTAGWFEGLMQFNREALFQRSTLWKQLDHFVTTLEEEDFRRCLVPLRRAFSSFSKGQTRRIVSCLLQASPQDAQSMLDIPEVSLSEEETKTLQEQLSDLNWDDLDLGM